MNTQKILDSETEALALQPVMGFSAIPDTPESAGWLSAGYGAFFTAGPACDPAVQEWEQVSSFPLPSFAFGDEDDDEDIDDDDDNFDDMEDDFEDDFEDEDDDFDDDDDDFDDDYDDDGDYDDDFGE
ncbi:MAG: hypothetical protein LBQ46_09920 [Treponema sp.]|nr:hypothetical protein [Treponema sp.]